MVYSKADLILKHNEDFDLTYGGVGEPRITRHGWDEFGRITAASLLLKGDARWVKVSRLSEPSLPFPQWEVYLFGEQIKRIGVFTQDVEGEVPLDSIAMCLRAAQSKTRGSICLILAPVELDGEPTGLLYRRIGIGSLEPGKDSEADWEVLHFDMNDLCQYSLNRMPF